MENSMTLPESKWKSKRKRTASPGPRPRTERPEMSYLQPPDPPSDSESTDMALEFGHILRELSNFHKKACEQRRYVEDQLERANEELMEIRLRLADAAMSSLSQSTCEEKSDCNMNEIVDGEPCVHFLSDNTPQGKTAPTPRTSVGMPLDLRANSRQTLADDFALMKGWKTYMPLTRELSGFGSHVTRSVTNTAVFDVVDKWRSSRTTRLVESRAFDACATIAIIANAILVGVAVDYSARHGVQMRDNPMGFRLLERAFTVVFACELVLRLHSGIPIFFFGVKKWWNLFDLIVVVSDIVQTILELVDKAGAANLSILRMMRIVRISRALRVIRLVRFFKELRMMIYSILRCSTSLLWSLLLFIIIFYVFGVFLMAQVTDYMGDGGSSKPWANKLNEFFGDMPRALLILYASMSGGISWKEVFDALVAVHWFNGVALAFFVFFALFVVANIVTGIFVDTAIQTAACDREEIIQEQLSSQESEMMVLKQIFVAADRDDSGHITLQEFEQHLADVRVHAHLSSLGIQVHEAFGLFKLLDQDDSGEVGIEEFVMGCVRLKGGATSIDLATLLYENKKLVEHIANLDRLCCEHFKHLRKSIDRMLHHFSVPGVSESTGYSSRWCGGLRQASTTWNLVP